MSVSSREERFFAGLAEVSPDCIAFAKHYLALPDADPVPSLQSFLDNPPFALMPRTIIVDITGPDFYRIRYFGTMLAELVGEDYTGFDQDDLKARGIAKSAWAWEGTNHPCGFLSKRVIFRRTHLEKMEATFELVTLTLPIKRESNILCVLIYSGMPRLVGGLPAPKKKLPLYSANYDVIPLGWIDIGAGVPDRAI